MGAGQIGFRTNGGIPQVVAVRDFGSNTNLLLQGRGIGGFAEPSVLFGNAEQGAWWDFSDLDSMYQEDTCNTKAALESTVGFIADKRLQTRGPEVSPDPFFQVATAPGVNNGTWNTGLSGVSSCTIGNGHAILNSPDGTGGGSFSTPIAATTIGKWYEITLFVNKMVGQFSVYYSGSQLTPIPTGSSGIVKIIGKADGVNVGVKRTSAGYLDISQFSVKEYTGNHLVQPTAGARPTLSRRYNLLTKTEDLSDASWAKNTCTVTPNNALAPDNTLTADLVTEDTSVASGHFVQYSTFNTTSGVTYRIRAQIKSNGRRYIALFAIDFAGNVSVLGLDTELGQLQTISGTTNLVANASCVRTNNGFFIVTADWVPASTGASIFAVRPLIDTTFAGRSYTGDGVSGFYAWGMQVMLASDAALAIPDYQRVNTATNYDTLGFPAYLLFDGATKWMQSVGAIMFSGNTLTSIVGQTTFVGAGTMLYETSANFTANDGTFALEATAGIQYVGGLRGTVSFETAQSGSVGSPDTSVLGHVIDSSQATALTRTLLYRNNTALALTPGSGTTVGPLTAQTLFVGARAGTSIWFNGRMYGLILRNALTNSNDFSMCNKWMGSKCGLFF